VGATREFAARCAGGDTTFVAHAPERLAVGHGTSDLASIPHLVGGIDDASTQLSARFLTRVCRDVVTVASPEVSELSKLLENAFISVGIALVAEITKIAGAADTSARAVTDAAATKPFGYFPFHPGAGIGGHCIPNDLELLRHSAAALGVSTPLLAAASATRVEMSAVAVDRLQTLLEREGIALAGAEILVVGTGFKVGSADQAASPAGDVVRELRDRQARPSFLDSANDELVVNELAVPRVLPSDLAVRRFAAAMMVAGDREVSLDLLRSSASIVFDAGGGAIVPGSVEGVSRL
jgi:UDP-N-acetyl-D-glucosamine dehydrogenase